MRYIIALSFLFSANLFFAQTSFVSAPVLESEVAHEFRLHYNLQKPAASFIMPASLEEISGLSMTPDFNKIVAVQDEDGEVFFINKKTGEVERDYNFYKEGDYEGIEMVGRSAFVVKSNGKIYEVHDIGGEHQQTIKFTTPLNKEFDVEGLGYDPKSKCLLMCCKERGDVDILSLEKSIYAFDLQSRTLIEEPIYTLRLADFMEYLKHNQHIHRYKKVVEHFSEEPDDFGFASSGIAVSPRTGNMYILSSKGKMMGVLSQEGKILHVEKLEKEIHGQPEGICFDKDGTLYISNEAKKGKPACIYRFDYEE